MAQSVTHLLGDQGELPPTRLLRLMESEWGKLRPFRWALSKEDQEAFARPFDRAKKHTNAGVHMANPWPMETILLSICLEHGKIIEGILRELKEKKP